jgi:hypothetical protein
MESTDRATGYWTTRSDRDPELNARTAGVYLRADPSDLEVLDGGSEEERAELIAERLREWRAAAERLLTSGEQRRQPAAVDERAHRLVVRSVGVLLAASRT